MLRLGGHRPGLVPSPAGAVPGRAGHELIVLGLPCPLAGGRRAGHRSSLLLAPDQGSSRSDGRQTGERLVRTDHHDCVATILRPTMLQRVTSTIGCVACAGMATTVAITSPDYLLPVW